MLAIQKAGWCQHWLQGSCKAKQPCALQRAIDTHSASQQMARYFQLGVGDTEDMRVPTLVAVLQGKRVVHVAAGEFHTICSTADGSVFTWGAGEFGKLDLGNDQSRRLRPTLVRGEVQGKQVVQVAAGDRHSACATEDNLVCPRGEKMIQVN